LPRSIIFELTQQCNNHCGYCYNIWRDPQFEYERHCCDEMSTDEIKRAISKLQEEMPLSTIGLSGGEPTLRNDLPEILAFIKSKELKSILVTNGSHLTEEYVEKTMVGGAYEVTLLSWRPEVHDRMAGRKGAWDAVIDGMMNIHAAGGHLSAVFVATRQNWLDLKATAELTIELGANELMYNRINAGAANLRLADELFLTPKMVEQNLQTLDDIAAKYHFPISVAVVVEPCIVDVLRFTNLSLEWCPLAGENSAFIVDPSGNIRICEHSPVVLGNIRRDHFRDIFQHPYVESFRSTLPLECEDCRNILRGMCRGGCKAAAAQAYGSFEHVEPFVRMNR
jgi:radical SAM protein with 4Fe4S-binding SPASM domain